MASQDRQRVQGRLCNPTPGASEQPGDARTENELLKLNNEQLLRKLAAASRQVVAARRLADEDGLTGLPNRRLLIKRLQWTITNARQQRRQLALLFIDLDGFKGVNDRFGHLIGDKLLTIVAARIAACVRSDDIACRYGGDEFVVLLSNISDPAIAVRIAGKIGERIGRSYRVAGVEVRVTASIGLAIYPDDAERYDELLRHADAAMYRNKLARVRDLAGATVPPHPVAVSAPG